MSMNLPLMIVLIFAAMLMFLLILLCMAKGKNYAQIAKDSGTGLGELLVIGFGACELLKINFKSEKRKRKIKQFQILYGEKYGEYYYRVNLASKITVFLLVLTVGVLLAVVMKNVIMVAVAFVAALALAYYFETLLTDQTKARIQSIDSDFSEMLSTLALLVNAGMILREAWEKTSEMKTGTLYDEMKIAVQNMNNGMGEAEAYVEFAHRCDSTQVTKFISTLIQNISKGNAELTILLQEFAREAWTEKKEAARQKGEAASSKLLIPIGLMFIGLLVMICLPIFSNMGF